MSDIPPETAIPPSTCPTCGDIHDAAVEVAGRGRPRPGDLTVCFGCGTILVFTEKLAERRAEPNDLASLNSTERSELENAQAFLREFNRRHGRQPNRSNPI